MNNIKTVLLIITLLIICPSISKAQNNFINGYVVTLTDDTVRGLINYHNSGRNPIMIEFSNNKTVSPIKYSPSMIKSFFVGGEYYFSRIVDIDVSSEDLNEIRHVYSKEPKMKQDTAFLTGYVVAKTSLYYLKDRYGKEHYFIENDSVTELIHNKYVIEGQEKMVIESDKFKQQLIVNMSDCEGMTTAINNVKFKSSDLIKLFKKYNSCKKNELMYIKNIEKVKMEINVIAGCSIITTTMTSPESYFYYGNGKFKPSFNPLLGLGFNLSLPRNRRSWGIYNELMYKRNKSSCDIDSSSLNYSLYKHFEIDFTYLNIVTMLRYQYPGSKIKPFINVGMVNSFVMKYSDKENIKVVSPLNNYSDEMEMMNTINKYDKGFSVGVGVIYKKLNVELRYERTYGFSSDAVIHIPSNGYFILLGYRFSDKGK